MLTQKMKQPFKTAQPVLFPPLADRAAWESLPGAARWTAAGQAALAPTGAEYVFVEAK